MDYLLNQVGLRVWPAFIREQARSRIATFVLDPLSRYPTAHRLAPGAIEFATVCCTASVFCRFLQAINRSCITRELILDLRQSFKVRWRPMLPLINLFAFSFLQHGGIPL